MIFLGDIASPNLSSSISLSRVLNENRLTFFGKRIICNFEGLLWDDSELEIGVPLLFNHSSILQTLKQGQEPIFCLANNHTLDLPLQFKSTIDQLNEKRILYCGAGRSAKEAEMPISFFEEGRNVFLFNACWNFLLYNNHNPTNGVYINEINETKLISDVKKVRSANLGAAIVIFLHWSLDLEILPFPMYRSFSRALIDAGANVIVGSHPHCVQGGEKYEHGFIIYSLGNFFIPYNTFANGHLTFPDFARIQLAFEWNSITNEAICHWFEYQNTMDDLCLKHLSSEKFQDSVLLARHTPYRNMSDPLFIKYFKKHRRKNFLIPVYKDYHRYLLNNCYTAFLRLRAHCSRILAKVKIIKWQN